MSQRIADYVLEGHDNFPKGYKFIESEDGRRIFKVSDDINDDRYSFGICNEKGDQVRVEFTMPIDCKVTAYFSHLMETAIRGLRSKEIAKYGS